MLYLSLRLCSLSYSAVTFYFCANLVPRSSFPWPAVGKRELWENPFQACHRYHRCRLRTAQWNRMCRIRLFAFVISKWMLPELSFSDRWSRGTKLWERDCFCAFIYEGQSTVSRCLWRRQLFQILQSFDPDFESVLCIVHKQIMII